MRTASVRVEPAELETFAESEAETGIDADASAMLERVRAIARNVLAPRATAIDQAGDYPADILRELGAAGAFAAHLRRDAPDYGAAIQAIAAVSAVCGATGFLMWCHGVCGVYLAESGNPALDGDLLDALAAGRVLGATGMSNPMKTFSGIEPMLLRARRDGDGYVIDGALPWVSNLAPDHRFGAVATLVDATDPPHEVMFVARCDAPGLTLRRCPPFSAMEGTNTYSVAFSGYRVGPEMRIADPVRPFIGRIRAAFILLQCGMGLGVAQGAIESMRTVERRLGHVNAFLDDRPEPLQAELDELVARTLRLAQTPFSQEREFLIEVLAARVAASELALRAAQSALLHAGARGYLMSSAVQRRVRESHFVAIVTPAIKHLRKEIARLSEAAPAT